MHIIKTPLRYSRYITQNRMKRKSKVQKYSMAGLKFPHQLKHNVCLRKQYWENRLGLRAFAHEQIHKCTKYGLLRKWTKMGLNDTKFNTE